MSRKNLIKGLYDETSNSALTAVNSPASADAMPERTLAGPVRTMGLVLDREREQRPGILPGEAVQELEPDTIDPSFVRDRFAAADPDKLRLLEASIEANGQEVPILVRPHPGQPGRFQAAYGHRRLEVLRRLGRKVRAVVKPLSDQELVLAQGIENSARQDLSYIERAVFAGELEKRGFDRAAIMASLTVDKTELSRMFAITRSIPADVIAAIGSAPATGRRRWMDLASLMEEGRRLKAVERLLRDERIDQYDSDTRFLRAFAAAAGKQRSAEKPQVWKLPTGQAGAKVTRSPKGTVIAFSATVDPQFADFVAEQLDELHKAFQSRQPKPS